MSRPIAITFVTFIASTIAYSNLQATQTVKCVTSTGYNGFCVNIYQCEPLLRILRRYPLDQNELEYLQSTRCGAEGKNPKVCCVPEIISVGPVGFV